MKPSTQSSDHWQLGLTLLELMIVIAIIGILATIAIPSYQRYSQRAKFSEVVQAVSPYKIAVGLCAHQMEDLASCSTPGQHGLPENFTAATPNAGYVATITVAPGNQDTVVITATSQRIKIGDRGGFEYQLEAARKPNGQLAWAVQDSGEKSCTHYGLC